MKGFILITVFSFLVFGCANPVEKAVNKVKYSAWETVGYEKRDLFKREVGNVKEEQEDTQEAFKDALTQLKEIYGFEGGDLEREQKKLASAYDDAAEEAQEVHERISNVDRIANDLFDEWEDEMKEIQAKDLRKKAHSSSRRLKQGMSSFTKNS